MILSELYRFGKHELKKNGIEDYACDALLLMEACFGVDRMMLAVKGDTTPDAKSEQDYLNKISRRCEGYPLQYLIGTWPFMNRMFFVGEGVLVPREDTEAVTTECLRRLEGRKKPRVIDLCSGSGAIAVTVALERPDAEVYALELSEAAFAYLQKNIEANKASNVHPILGDVFSKHEDMTEGYFDVIVSNPPYICSSEIPTLAREVLNEPHLALDGGAEGLDFYNSIIKNWVSKLKSDGCFCFEIDPAQATAVSNMLTAAEIVDIQISKDMQEMNRAISGKRVAADVLCSNLL